MRKLIISAVVGGIIIFASLYFAGLIADSKENRRPPSQKVVKTVFVDTVQNATIPIMVPANGNLQAKKEWNFTQRSKGYLDQEANCFERDSNTRPDKHLFGLMPANTMQRCNLQKVISTTYLHP